MRPCTPGTDGPLMEVKAVYLHVWEVKVGDSMAAGNAEGWFGCDETLGSGE